MANEGNTPARPGHHAYNWLAIRKDHAMGMSVSAIARKYGLRRQTIQDRAKAERWTDKNAQIASRAVARAEEMAVQKTAEAVADGLIRHTEIETLLLDVAKSALEKAKACDFKVIGESKTTDVEAMERAVNAASKAIDKSREINGLRAGQPSVGEVAREDRTIRFITEAESA